MPPTKRKIIVKISPDGQLSFDNSKNPDAKRIMDELSELAELLTGDPQAFTIEKHVHTAGHAHTHEDGQVHVH